LSLDSDPKGWISDEQERRSAPCTSQGRNRYILDNIFAQRPGRGSQVFGAMLIPVKWDIIHQRFVIVELAIAMHRLFAIPEFAYPFVFFSLFIISIGIYLPHSLSLG